MKKPKTVIDAEAALSAKTAEVDAAEEALKRLRLELGIAYAAVQRAQIDADANQPQCKIVRPKIYSGSEEEITQAAILRRTPGGMLVVRAVGNLNGTKYKFKWSQDRAVYTLAEKVTWSGSRRELRDVPVAYLPQADKAA